jgi:hypothetical protein
MGRQLPIYATPDDESELLRFIETLSAIRVFRTFARNREGLWIDDWQHCPIDCFDYSVWLREFEWLPEYGQTGGPGCPPDRSGMYYFSNAGTAPVLEISRPPQGTIYGGRIYWAGNFSAAKGLSYDASVFSSHVDKIWRWIRRKGRRQRGDGSAFEPYILPQAFAELVDRQPRGTLAG